MNELKTIGNCIPAMTAAEVDKVRSLETFLATLPQEDMETFHMLHGGMYCRTILIPAGVMLTGALIKVATLLIIQGDAIAYIGDKSLELIGYNVLAGSANRKQAFFAKVDTYLTMIFSTTVRSITEAEDEFTDEADLLLSRKYPLNNKIIITGE